MVNFAHRVSTHLIPGWEGQYLHYDHIKHYIVHQAATIQAQVDAIRDNRVPSGRDHAEHYRATTFTEVFRLTVFHTKSEERRSVDTIESDIFTGASVWGGGVWRAARVARWHLTDSVHPPCPRRWSPAVIKGDVDRVSEFVHGIYDQLREGACGKVDPVRGSPPSTWRPAQSSESRRTWPPQSCRGCRLR